MQNSSRKSTYEPPSDKICYEYLVPVGEHTVRFLCFKTAWLSMRNETQGQLFMPSDVVPLQDHDYSLVIAASHHPLNWIEANNARQFSTELRQTTDMMVTDHEHNYSYSERRQFPAGTIIELEGAVLQDTNDGDSSGFNFLVFDLDKESYFSINYEWNGTRFVTNPTSVAEYHQLNTNRSRQHGRFMITEHMEEWRRDPGIALNHHDSGELTLSDIFVYPDLMESDFRFIGNHERISDDHVEKFLSETRTVLITGDTLSGKTSMAKSIFTDALKLGYIPVFIDASTRPPWDDRVNSFIERKFESQFDED